MRWHMPQNALLDYIAKPLRVDGVDLNRRAKIIDFLATLLRWSDRQLPVFDLPRENCDALKMNIHIVGRKRAQFSLDCVSCGNAPKIIIAEMIDVRWLSDFGDALRCGIYKRVAGLPTIWHQVHIVFISDRFKNADHRVLVDPNLDVGINV